MFSDTATIEAMGKVANVLFLARKAIEHGDNRKTFLKVQGPNHFRIKIKQKTMIRKRKNNRVFYAIMMTGILSILLSSVKAQDYKTVEEANGLSVGTSAPMYTAITEDSTLFSLDKALENGPVVMIFYRGFWCPVCNKHLSTIQDSLKLIEEKGAKVIAISPEKPEYLEVMAEKTDAAFTLLYDEGYKIADAYDVAFKPSRATLFTYNTFLGAKLKGTHSDDSQRLPIPATYIIGTNGKIAWRQFNPDYKKRSTVADILKSLESMP